MRRKLVSSLLLFLAVLGAYLVNGRTIGAGDTFPAAYLPWSLLRQQNFDLDEFPILHDARARQTFPMIDGTPYYLQHRNGHYLSAYGPWAGVLALPVYTLPIVMGVEPSAMWADRLEKLSAAIITALSVVFLHWALRQVASRSWALTIALVYALGTSSLSMSSQGLWQHGPSQLFLSLALCFLVRGLRDERYLGYAGLPLAAAVVMRSSNLVIVLPVAAWIVYAHRSRAQSLVLWALPPAAAVVTYYAVYFATPDQDLGHTTAPLWAFFTQMPLSESLPGVLVSPTRGLFVYSPVLLFSIVGMIMVWRDGPVLWRALSLGLPLGILVTSKWLMWWGGHSWGPRLLADLTPFLCFFLYPVTAVLDRRRLLKAVFVILALWSVVAHALGAWLYDRRWDAFASDRIHARLWPSAEIPLAFYGREALLRLKPRQTDESPTGSLAASYRIDPAPSEVMSGERFVIRVSAANVGGAVWRASTLGDRGAMRLGWRWYRGDQQVSVGAESLLADVPPGGSVQVEAKITSPVSPGEYTLILDLFSDGITWFGDRGQKPVRLAVTVLPLEIAPLLSGPMLLGQPAPRVRIATDRPSYRRDVTLRLRATVKYPHYPRSFDLYFVLEQPDGQALFFDGTTTPRRAESDWVLLGKGLPLPARIDSRFALPLSGLSPGAYRWHLVLTEPGSYQAVARGTAGFTIEP